MGERIASIIVAAGCLASIALAPAAQASTPLILPANALAGYQPAKLSPATARKDLGRGLPIELEARIRGADVQAAGAQQPGRLVSSEAFVFGSAKHAKEVHGAWRKANDARPVKLKSAGALAVAGSRRSARATVVWRQDQKLGLLAVETKAGPRAARATAFELARAADSALRNPLPETGWGQVWDQVEADGVVSRETALEAVEIAYGPVPGVKAPKGRAERFVEATPAARAVMPFLDDLSPAQREAVNRYLGLIESPQARMLRSYGDPEFEPDPVLQQRAQGWVSAFEGRLGHTLQIPVVVGETTADPVSRAGAHMIADTLPINAFGGSNFPSCRVRFNFARNVSDAFTDLVMAHEIFHCFQFDLAPQAWSASQNWVVEGSADWAALMVDPLNEGFGNLSVYIRTQTPLQARSYDAVGFWGHVHDATGNAWARLPGAIAAGGDFGAAYNAAVGGAEEHFLSTWGSSRFRRSGEPIWGMVSPPIAKTSFSQQKPAGMTTIRDDQPVFAGAFSTGNHLIHASKERPIVHVAIAGPARLSDAFNYTALSDAWFCSTASPDGCKPPENVICTLPATEPLDNDAPLGLAAAGTPTTGVVHFYSPEEFCRGKKKDGVNGRWNGDWSSAQFGDTGTFSMTLKQSGKEFSGEITIQGSPCVKRGKVSGRVEGEGIKFGAVKAEHHIAYTGTVQGDQMEGSWSKAAQGRCAADHGAWSAAR